MAVGLSFRMRARSLASRALCVLILIRFPSLGDISLDEGHYVRVFRRYAVTAVTSLAPITGYPDPGLAATESQARLPW